MKLAGVLVVAVVAVSVLWGVEAADSASGSASSGSVSSSSVSLAPASSSGDPHVDELHQAMSKANEAIDKAGKIDTRVEAPTQHVRHTPGEEGNPCDASKAECSTGARAEAAVTAGGEKLTIPSLSGKLLTPAMIDPQRMPDHNTILTKAFVKGSKAGAGDALPLDANEEMPEFEGSESRIQEEMRKTAHAGGDGEEEDDGEEYQGEESEYGGAYGGDEYGYQAHNEYGGDEYGHEDEEQAEEMENGEPSAYPDSGVEVEQGHQSNAAEDAAKHAVEHQQGLAHPKHHGSSDECNRQCEESSDDIEVVDSCKQQNHCQEQQQQQQQQQQSQQQQPQQQHENSGSDMCHSLCHAASEDEQERAACKSQCGASSSASASSTVAPEIKPECRKTCSGESHEEQPACLSRCAHESESDEGEAEPTDDIMPASLPANEEKYAEDLNREDHVMEDIADFPLSTPEPTPVVPNSQLQSH
eukprot:TRINITY_DN66469_c9_g7_i1.p1 TRINITY_DN66469_c9_g7~~TRINITY_DN66469_c9_g7_i1.p1  ORF type:complete len:472 (+),score=251.04 TRINITY_DN66469_c9_g7_i1:44-1459(+)